MPQEKRTLKNTRNREQKIENKRENIQLKKCTISLHFSAVLSLQKGCLYRWEKFIEGKQVALEELKSISGTLRIYCLVWDSSAWERDDLGGTAEHEPASKQRKRCFHTEGSRSVEFCLIILRY